MALYAAVDIGSNSVRMMLAEAGANGSLKIIAEDRSVVRLGAGVFLQGRILEDSLALLCDRLARIAATLAGYKVAGLRAVATSAVRDASNQAEFLDRSQRALGAPIEIISGQEEARLIHLGVQLRWPQPESRTLIIDVGGGSAEIIASHAGTITGAFSKPLGSVRLAESFLKNDPPSPAQLRQMEDYIAEQLGGPARRLQGPFDRVVGTSATAAALACAVNGIERSEREEADRLEASTEQIRPLYQRLCALDLAGRRKVTGIGPKRAELIVAGAAVFLRALEVFGQSSFSYSVAGVRDGIIAGLAAMPDSQNLARLTAEQRAVVEEISARYGMQPSHAHQVARFARSLFLSLEPLHRLSPAYGRLLEAAALLHDIGHFVNPTGHHKHSYYLVENSELPGFTGSERRFIAALCRYHRKTAPSPGHQTLQDFNPAERRAITLLTPILRLADSLDRGHVQSVRDVQLEIAGGQPSLSFRAEARPDLILWAAARAAELFRSAYGTPLVLKPSLITAEPSSLAGKESVVAP